MAPAGRGLIRSHSTMDDALAPAQLSTQCSLQAGREQPREMLLQNYKFPTIPTPDFLDLETPTSRELSSKLKLQRALGKVSLYLALRKPWKEK